jgi:pimeloyl-ACP methyl ester carboxylesterase
MLPPMVEVDHHEVPNGDGWRLSLRRTRGTDPARGRNPVLIIPGYGMNSFIFGFHPRGESMEASLARRGFEMWSVDLRGQGRSRSDGGSHRYGLADLVLKDLFCAVHGVLERTATGAGAVDLVGCSLGASMMFAYVVCVPDSGAGKLVSMGGPVRWTALHPLLRAAFASPWIVGLVPVRGARRMARVALPALARVPWLLRVYLHPEIVDMTKASTLVETVEDPNRHVNRDIARWIRARDLVIDGKNVSELVRTELRNPLLTVIANADGIVPRETAIWPHLHAASEQCDLLEVGTSAVPIAHADMFVSDHAPAMVFEPLAAWLAR